MDLHNHNTRRPPHKRNRDVYENDGQGSASAGVNTPTMSARGGTRSGKGGKKFSVSSRDGNKDAIEVSTTSSSTVGFEMSTSSISAGVRVTESGVRLRDGTYIRGNSPTKFSTNESSGLRTMNGNVVRSMSKGDGSRSRIYPDGIRPIGYGVKTILTLSLHTDSDPEIKKEDEMKYSRERNLERGK
nr:hypothetical protein [Tanacetum cinerariifolium]